MCDVTGYFVVHGQSSGWRASWVYRTQTITKPVYYASLLNVAQSKWDCWEMSNPENVAGIAGQFYRFFAGYK